MHNVGAAMDGHNMVYLIKMDDNYLHPIQIIGAQRTKMLMNRGHALGCGEATDAGTSI